MTIHLDMPVATKSNGFRTRDCVDLRKECVKSAFDSLSPEDQAVIRRQAETMHNNLQFLHFRTNGTTNTGVSVDTMLELVSRMAIAMRDNPLLENLLRNVEYTAAERKLFA